MDRRLPGRGRRFSPAPAVVLVLAVTVAPRLAAATGFQVTENSARALGAADAGEAAAAEDASTVYNNPAGLTLLSGTQFVGSGFAIVPRADFRNGGSTLNPAVGGGPLTGGNGGSPGTLALFPTFFLAHELTDRVRFGLGVTVPFGLEDHYENGWVGRYHTISARLETVNVQPTIAVKITDWLSVGGGGQAEYAKARLSNSIDLGSVCRLFGAQQGVTPAVCDALGLRPQQVDGQAIVSGDSWSAGWNAGVMYTPTPSTRFGLTFRSRVQHELQGEARFQVPPAARVIQTTGALVNTGGRAGIDLPERVALGAFHQMNPRWALLADVTWTHWSRFRTLTFRFDNPKQPPIVEHDNWNDAFRYTLGVRYSPTPAWTFRLGTAYDQTPVPDPQHRTPRIPDSDRIWIAAGVGVRVWSNVQFHLGYAHLFALKASIDNPDPITGHRIRGEYTATSADLMGLQVTYDFQWPPLGPAQSLF